MSDVLPARLIALCGSETRVRTLGVLAATERPMTGYRIGRAGGIPLPKVYRELKRLRRSGLVRQDRDGWTLADPHVAALFREHLRIVPAGSSGTARREREVAAVVRKLRALPRPRFPRRWAPRQPARFRRDPAKDALLERRGLRTSPHGRSKRA